MVLIFWNEFVILKLIHSNMFLIYPHKWELTWNIRISYNYVYTFICKAGCIIYNFFSTKFDTEHLAINWIGKLCKKMFFLIMTVYNLLWDKTFNFRYSEFWSWQKDIKRQHQPTIKQTTRAITVRTKKRKRANQR